MKKAAKLTKEEINRYNETQRKITEASNALEKIDKITTLDKEQKEKMEETILTGLMIALKETKEIEMKEEKFQ